MTASWTWSRSRQPRVGEEACPTQSQQTARLSSEASRPRRGRRARRSRQEVELLSTLLGRSVAGRRDRQGDGSDGGEFRCRRLSGSSSVTCGSTSTCNLRPRELLPGEGRLCGRPLAPLRCPWAHIGVVVLVLMPHVQPSSRPSHSPPPSPRPPAPMQLVDLRLRRRLDRGFLPPRRPPPRPPAARAAARHERPRVPRRHRRPRRPELGAAHPAVAGASGPSSATGSRAKIGLNHTRALLEAMPRPRLRRSVRHAQRTRRHRLAAVRRGCAAPRLLRRALRAAVVPLIVPPPRSPPAAASAA